MKVGACLYLRIKSATLCDKFWNLITFFPLIHTDFATRGKGAFITQPRPPPSPRHATDRKEYTRAERGMKMVKGTKKEEGKFHRWAVCAAMYYLSSIDFFKIC